jgi:hypothetical protein
VETGAAIVDHRCVKAEEHAVAAGHTVNPARWQEAFEGLMSRIAGRFTRAGSRRLARKLVLGLLSDLPRKNCRTIAERAGDRTPDGMQHLLGRAKRDAGQARDDVSDYVAEHLHRLATPPPCPTPDQPLPATSRPSMKITIYGWSTRWSGILWGVSRVIQSRHGRGRSTRSP